MLPVKYSSIWPSGFRGEEFFTSTNQKQGLPMAAIFVVRSGRNESETKLCKGPPIDASCRVWFHLATRFQRRRFLKIRPIRNKNCPWRPYLLSDRDEMRKLYKGPYIDASCQVWFHLAEWFQRRRLKCEQLTTTTDDDGRRTLHDGKSSPWPFGSGELKTPKQNRRCTSVICVKRCLKFSLKSIQSFRRSCGQCKFGMTQDDGHQLFHKISIYFWSLQPWFFYLISPKSIGVFLCSYPLIW